MYKITCDNFTVFETGNPNLIALDFSLDRELNTSNLLVFSVAKTHPYYDYISAGKIIRCYINEKWKFTGELSKATVNIYGTKSFSVYGVLSKFSQTVQDFHENANYTITEYVQLLLNRHNSQIDEKWQLKLGNITVTDSNDNIYRGLSYDITSDAISDDLISSLGGYIQIREEEDGFYFDYLEDFTTIKSQALRFGSNVINSSISQIQADIYNVIFPLGAKLSDETDERLTIASANNGIEYLEDEDSIEAYGRRVLKVTYDDVTTAAALLSKAAADLEANKYLISSLELNAIDLSKMGYDVAEIDPGDYVLVDLPIYDFKTYMQITKVTDNASNPAESKIYAGKKISTVSDNNVKIDKIINTITENYTTNETLSSAISNLIVNSYNEYALSTSATVAPTTGWTTGSIPWETGYYTWRRTVTEYKTGDPVYGTAVMIQGAAGANGVGSYTFIRYSANASGNPMSETADIYIGIQVTSNSTASTDYNDYTWSKWQGADGEDGIGIPGADGETYYVHTAYCNDPVNNSDNSFTTSNELSTGEITDRLYIGQYTDTTLADSTDYTDYIWTLAKGSDGTDGADGETNYTWEKYADSANPANDEMYDSVIKDCSGFISGIANAGTGTPAGNPTINLREIVTTPSNCYGMKIAYQTVDLNTLGLYVCDDDGVISGENLFDSTGVKTPIVTAYAINSSGVPYSISNYSYFLVACEPNTNYRATGFNAFGTTASTCFYTTVDYYSYIGRAYNQTTETESTDSSSYLWSKFVGTDGKYQTSQVEYFYISTSATEQVGGSWSTEYPTTWETGYYVWQRWLFSFSDGSFDWSEPVVNAIWNNINDKLMSQYSTLLDIQDQIDGVIEAYFGEYVPTLENEPAVTWTDDTEKYRHLNDTFTNISTSTVEVVDTIVQFSDGVSNTNATVEVFANENLLLGTYNAKTGVGTGINNQNAISSIYFDNYEVIAGQTVTISFDWEYTGNTFDNEPNFYLMSSAPTYLRLGNTITVSEDNISGRDECTTVASSSFSSTYVYFRFNYVVGDVIISNLKLELGDTATPWVANAADDTNAVSSFELTRCGKNLVNFTVGEQYTTWKPSDYIRIKESTVYKFQVERKVVSNTSNSSNIQSYVSFYDKNKTLISGSAYYSISGVEVGETYYSSATVTSPVDAFYVVYNIGNYYSNTSLVLETVYCQIEESTVYTSYEPYTADTYTITPNVPISVPLLATTNTFFTDSDVDLTVQYQSNEAGSTYKFVSIDDVYQWAIIGDSEISKVYQELAATNAAVDGKVSTYLEQPTNYVYGDIWILSDDWGDYSAGEMLFANATNYTFNADDWGNYLGYTTNGEFEALTTTVQTNNTAITQLSTEIAFNATAITEMQGDISSMTVEITDLGITAQGIAANVALKADTTDVEAAIELSAYDLTVSLREGGLQSDVYFGDDEFNIYNANFNIYSDSKASGGGTKVFGIDDDTGDLLFTGTLTSGEDSSFKTKIGVFDILTNYWSGFSDYEEYEGLVMYDGNTPTEYNIVSLMSKDELNGFSLVTYSSNCLPTTMLSLNESRSYLGNGRLGYNSYITYGSSHTEGDVTYIHSVVEAAPGIAFITKENDERFSQGVHLFGDLYWHFYQVLQGQDGDYYAYPQSIKVPIVKTGTLTLTPSNEDTTQDIYDYYGSASVTFSTSFSSAPIIHVQAHSVDPHKVQLTISNANSSGFTVYLRRTAATSTSIKWTAIENIGG